MEACVSLRNLLPESRFVGGDDVHVSRVVNDASECLPGDLLAILPSCDDPTEAGCRALARGAGGLLTEQLLPIPLPQCIVRDVERAAASVCDELFSRPVDDLLMIGVVGGDGKTTTSLLLANLMRSQGIRTAYETDLGCCDGVVQTTKAKRPNGVAATCEFLADARDAGSTIAILELSDVLVRSAAFDHLRFDVLVLTGGGNRRPVDGLGVTLEDIALERLREGGAAIVNGDCPVAMAAADRAGVPTLTFAMRNDANVSAKVFDQQPGETTLMVSTGDVTTVMETALTGPAMAMCQLAAVTAGLLMEFPVHQAIQSVTSLRQIPGRMQRIVEYGKPTVVLDVCGSSKRLGVILRGLRRERNGGKLWVIASGTCEQMAEETATMGRTAERYADKTVLTVRPSAKADFLRIAHNWLDGVVKPQNPYLIADRDAAIHWVLSNAQPQDTVLIAGGWAVHSPADQRSELEADAAMVGRILCQYAADLDEDPVILPFSSAK